MKKLGLMLSKCLVFVLYFPLGMFVLLLGFAYMARHAMTSKNTALRPKELYAKLTTGLFGPLFRLDEKVCNFLFKKNYEPCTKQNY